MTLRGGKVRADRITVSAWIAHPLHAARLWRWMATWGEPSRAVAHARYMRLLFAVTIAKADDRIGSARGWRDRLPDALRYQLVMGELPEVPAYADWQDATAEHVRGQLAHLPHATPAARKAPAETPELTPAQAPEPGQSERQGKRQPSASDRAKANAKAQRLMIANPAMSLADVAARSGVSERTASRIKGTLPRQLHVAEG